MKTIAKTKLIDGCEVELIDSVDISENPVESITQIAGLSYNKELVNNPEKLFEYLKSESAGNPSSVMEFAWYPIDTHSKEDCLKKVLNHSIVKWFECYDENSGVISGLANLRTIFNCNIGSLEEAKESVFMSFKDYIRDNIFTFKLKIPLWMFAQIVRHRKASYMSISRRRVKDVDSYEFYESDRSIDISIEKSLWIPEEKKAINYLFDLDDIIDLLKIMFIEKLKAGEPLEVASRIFPQNLFANIYIQYTNTEESWENFINLRAEIDKELGKTHTQLETCRVARAMYKLVEENIL